MDLTVVCVYKTDGDYDPEYVRNLQAGVGKHLTLPHRFVCLTDDLGVDFCECIPLKHGWPGWWSKIELFRPDLSLVNALYFDLDTVILGNIDQLAWLAFEFEFAALRGFNQRYSPGGKKELNLASGVMVGDFSGQSGIYEVFAADPRKYMTRSEAGWRHGDQGFIASVIGLDVPRLQDYLPENYIVGKKITRKGRLIPSEARVLAWSGKPRLHEIQEGSIIENWRAKE